MKYTHPGWVVLVKVLLSIGTDINYRQSFFDCQEDFIKLLKKMTSSLKTIVFQILTSHIKPAKDIETWPVFGTDLSEHLNNHFTP